MTNSIRTILMPFLIIKCVFGLRIVNLSSPLKLWLNVSYMLLIWSVYYLLSTSAIITFFDKNIDIEDHVCFWLENLTTLLSTVLGIYYTKKFQNCLKKFDFIDNTLFKLGTVTDYNKMHKKTRWLVFGWFVIVILINCSSALVMSNEYDLNVTTTLYLMFFKNYFFHINFIGDLTIASIFQYTGLKFDQVNEHLHNLIKNKKQACKYPVMHPYQRKFSKVLNRKRIIWIITHLHLELRKISCEIDSIFGTQMTFNMACYFGWIAINLREIFRTLLIKNYAKSTILRATGHFLWLSHNVFKFLLVNYVCETVTTKASATADILNRLSYFTRDIEIREIISQFSLLIVHTPLRFYGIGFFQFGYKFLHRFIMSIATVLVIIIQANENM